MFKEILQIVRDEQLERHIDADLQRMLEIAAELVTEGGRHFWTGPVSHEDRLTLYGKAEVMNDTERRVRNLMVVHLKLETSTDRAHFFGLLTLLKEVERLGERAKNLVELSRAATYPLPNDDIMHELGGVREMIEAMVRELPHVLEASDVKRAQELDEQGRATIQRCETAIARVARSRYEATHAVTITLGAQVYARVQRQLLNILSSLTLPLHSLDFYEDRLPDDWGNS